MSYFPYSFEGEVVHHGLGGMIYTAVFLPPEIAAALPFKGRALRATGEVNDAAFSAAWQPSRGRWYMMLSKKLLRDAGLRSATSRPCGSGSSRPTASRRQPTSSACWPATPRSLRRGTR